MSPGLAVLATVVSGWLYGLSFPLASQRWLAWIALVPWLLAVRRAGAGGALALGWLWTIVAAYAVGDWFVQSLASYYHQPRTLGVAFFFGVASLLAAPWYMAVALWYRALAARLAGPRLVLLTAAAWTAAELARGRVVSGNPWALVGYSQVGWDRVVQIADLAGIYGVSFIVVLANAAVAEALAARATARRSLGLAALATLAVLAYGEWRLATVMRADAATPALAVAMVQGNLDNGSQWREEFYGTSLDTYLRLTRDVLHDTRPDLVLWPENALTFFLEREPAYRRAIAQVLAPAGVELVTGGPRIEDAASPRYFNSIFLVSPAGEIRARYDKQRLVPFGERFPLPWFATLSRRFGRVREFTPGASGAPLPTAIGAAGVTICSEAMFPEVARARVRDGAVFFIDPANDTWLTPRFSAQQFDIVRLRTVEERRYLVRASTSGPSAVVDPLGRVAVHTDFFTQAAIVGTIHPRTEITPYARVGDLFAATCTVVALAAWGWAARRRTVG
jgi:apolipoprotein N-acyltransferase